MRLWSLQGRIALVVVCAVIVALVVARLVQFFFTSDVVAWWLALTAGVLLAFIAVALLTRHLQLRLQALHTGLLNFLDNDFSVTLLDQPRDDLGEILSLYNQVAEKLRQERQYLYQRELLLDTVIQNSTLALVLVDASGRVIYSNARAESLLGGGSPMTGEMFDSAVSAAPSPLQQMLLAGDEGLVQVVVDKGAEIYHLSLGRFVLHTQEHRLYLVRQMTREIHQKELDTWKKVVRIISHELNNSLAPITSMANSGRTLTERGQTDQLESIFATIGERAEHLREFMAAYGELARAPAPRLQTVDWASLLDRLKREYQFEIAGGVPAEPGYFDPGLMGQVLINLLKNAHESGSPVADIQLCIKQQDGWQIDVSDRGRGIGDAAMENVLLPYFTTKSEGSGLGLPLSREIIESHGGRLTLVNRKRGGVRARVLLPVQQATC